MKKWPHEICPIIFEKLQELKGKGGGFIAIWSGGPKFQISGGRGEQYIVDLDFHTYTCRGWDLKGFT